MLGLGIVAAFVSLFLFSLGDTFAKNASVWMGSHRAALYIVFTGSVPITVVFLLFPPASVTATLLLISSVSGVFLIAGYLLVYISLTTEQASNTWALISLSPAALILFGVLVLAEPLNALQGACTVAIFAGVLLITITREMKFNMKLIPAIIGNICFAAFIVLAAYGISSYPSSFSLFFFVPRVISVLVLLLYVALRPERFRATKREAKANGLWAMQPRNTAIISGLLDGAAQVPYMLVILLNFVALGGAITAAEPMLVVVLCYFMYGERLTPLQTIGVAVSVIGAISVGLI